MNVCAWLNSEGARARAREVQRKGERAGEKERVIKSSPTVTVDTPACMYMCLCVGETCICVAYVRGRWLQ